MIDGSEIDNKGHGGKREGAGRKPKDPDVLMVEKLTPLDDKAFKKLEIGIDKGEFPFIKLFFEYRFGKPKEKVDVTSNGQTLSSIKIVDVDGTEI